MQLPKNLNEWREFLFNPPGGGRNDNDLKPFGALAQTEHLPIAKTLAHCDEYLSECSKAR
jgi:hypothetical protein